MATVKERLLARIQIDDNGCWLWTGPLKSTGYATMWADGAMRWVHRVSYEQHIGPIPDDLSIDHLCRVHNCVNPGHLEPVTNAENVRRGLAARGYDTTCGQGHERSTANSYQDANGRTQCRPCQRRKQAEKYRRRASQGMPQRKSSRGQAPLAS